MEHDSAIKKNAIREFTGTWMKLQTIIQSEVNQTQKDKQPERQTAHILSHMWRMLALKLLGMYVSIRVLKEGKKLVKGVWGQSSGVQGKRIKCRCHGGQSGILEQTV